MVDVRAVLNAAFHVLPAGRQWQVLPKDLPPGSTVVWVGRDHRAHPSCALRRGARTGRARSRPGHGGHRQPDDAGRAKGGSAVDPSGHDAGKKVVGRIRHPPTATTGMRLAVSVHPAGVQDRAGAGSPLRQARRPFPSIGRIIGDAGCQEPRTTATVARPGTQAPPSRP